MATPDLESQISPVLSPGPTEFPHPTVESDASEATRVETEATTPPTPYRESQRPSLDDAGPPKFESVRPSIQAARNFNTERPRPASRASLLGLRRMRTGSGGAAKLANQTPAARPPFDSSDSSSSSEDESKSTPQRVRTNPGRQGKERPAMNKMGTTFRRRKEADSDAYGKFSVGNDDFKSKGKVSKSDGRLQISVNETANTGYLAKALGATIQHHLRPLHKHEEDEETDAEEDIARKDRQSSATLPGLPPPTLNIVIMVIGSRGDIQPFLKIGKILKEKHGHTVRIATHPAFKQFVEKDSGLEFFSVGGDPSELMAFMVKNPGLIPSVSTVRAGEIGRRREAMFEMFQGFWRACINATDEEKDVANAKMMSGKHPFVADAIIANPPSFAHVHCAEKLGIPLHLMFTFPYSPTAQFPHPLANIKKSNVDANYTNFMSYPLVEMMTWQGLGDLVNKFRVKTLGLEPMSTLWAPGQLFRLKVPYTYLWSPGLVPKPKDWGPEIDIAGFVYLDLASAFDPPATLTKFLEAGEPPVYIGFGSIVVDDPDKFTNLIFEAVKKAGVRALVSKGWGGLGDENNTPDNIYMLENTPHDWLFPRVGAVVHHGGAGTTAIGLKCGKPTMIVPFFGDQPFWGSMVASAGAGAEAPIPYKRLTADNLATGIRQCLSPSAKKNAQKIADSIAAEGDGAGNAVEAFHQSLPLNGKNTMRCSLFPDRVAVWRVMKVDIHLSALAADLLVESKRLRWQDLRLLRHYDWTDFQGPGEPITGGGAAILSSAGAAVKGVASIPARTHRGLKMREKMIRKQKKRTVGDGVALSGKGAQNGAVSSSGATPETKDFAQANFPGSTEPVQAPALSLLKTHSDIPMAETSEADMNATALTPKQSAGETELPSIPATIAKSTATGLGETARAIVSAPLDLNLAVSQGFHNAPRLYGDKTVRESPKTVTGIRSGLLAARDELRFGFLDGTTGIVKQPYLDTKAHGAVGVATGMGKGVGGLVLKPLAGVLGVTAYVGKGIQAEARKRLRDVGKTDRWVRRARIVQAGREIKELRETEGAAGSDGKGTDGVSKSVEQMRVRAVEQWEVMEQQREEEMVESRRRSVFHRASAVPMRHNHGSQ